MGKFSISSPIYPFQNGGQAAANSTSWGTDTENTTKGRL